jgi:hypothetical protein
MYICRRSKAASVISSRRLREGRRLLVGRSPLGRRLARREAHLQQRHRKRRTSGRKDKDFGKKNVSI